MRPFCLCLVILAACFASCVSTGKFNASQNEVKKYDSLYNWSQHTLKTCQDENGNLTKQKAMLRDSAKELDLQLTATKENNTQLRKQLRDLSAISSSQAESIKKSLDNMGSKDTYFRELQSALAGRDEANMAILMNLKAMMGGFGEQDVSIKVVKGTIYIDLSDSLLFRDSANSNSFAVTTKAKSVLGRIARVMRDNPGSDFMVVGNTDSLSATQDSLMDSWDLSLKRASTLVHIFQRDYNISPARMTAAGRGQYEPAGVNDTPEGRTANRRTRIVIFPQVDNLLKALEHRPGQGESPTPAVSGS